MKVALLGDVALIGRFDLSMNPDANKLVQEIQMITQGCDFVIANLESPLTSITKTKKCKGVYLRSEPTNVKILQELGVTHVTLANNHVYDYGIKGARETIYHLAAAGIEYVGISGKTSLLEKNGERALLGGFCCYSANGLRYGDGRKADTIDTLSPELLDSFFCRAADKDAVPIVSAHFGVEGLHYPSVEHMRLFRHYAEMKHYVLHGNHPHVIQGYEMRRQSPLFYSMSDLCFDDCLVTSIGGPAIRTEENNKGMISIVEIINQVPVIREVFGLRMSADGVLCRSKTVKEELDFYSNALSRDNHFICEVRDAEQRERQHAITKKTIRFYLNRLNYKYIGAYLNGKKHAKEYHRIYGNWEDG